MIRERFSMRPDVNIYVESEAVISEVSLGEPGEGGIQGHVLAN